MDCPGLIVGVYLLVENIITGWILTVDIITKSVSLIVHFIICNSLKPNDLVAAATALSDDVPKQQFPTNPYCLQFVQIAAQCFSWLAPPQIVTL